MKLTTKTATFLLSFVIFSSCLILVTCESASGRSNPSAAAAKKIRTLSPSANRLFHLLRLGMSGSSIDDEDLQSDDDNFLQKRQYDDYGHMRFGKRGNGEKSFDDYGHLRFGK